MLVFFILIFGSNIIYGQGIDISNNYDKKYNSVSSSLLGGKYELVQSDIVARLTFKIDKYNGRVWQIVEKSDGSYSWDMIEKEESKNDVKIENKINYQFFMSGLAVRFSYLINVNTGIVWQVVEKKDKSIYLSLVE